MAEHSVQICADPIFVIGSPRSGTTALAGALGCHSRLWTSHESYIVHHLYGNNRANEAWRRDAQREQAPSWLKTEGVPRQEFLGYLGAGVNALYTSRSAGRRWVDQTPLNTLMVDDLGHMFPGAKFVHILRDGRRVVDSMGHFLAKFRGRPAARKYVPAWATDFAEACRTWRQWVEIADDFCDRNPTRALTIVNERFSDVPEETFAGLFLFLAVEWEDGPVEAMTGERVNSSFVGAAAASARGGGLPEWDPERRSGFVEEAGDLMVKLGLATPEDLDRWVAGPAGVRPGISAAPAAAT
jgi:hypothetical protein